MWLWQKVMTLRPRQTGDDWRKMIKTIAGGKFTIGKAHWKESLFPLSTKVVHHVHLQPPVLKNDSFWCSTTSTTPLLSSWQGRIQMIKENCPLFWEGLRFFIFRAPFSEGSIHLLHHCADKNSKPFFKCYIFANRDHSRMHETLRETT